MFFSTARPPLRSICMWRLPGSGSDRVEMTGVLMRQWGGGGGTMGPFRWFIFICLFWEAGGWSAGRSWTRRLGLFFPSFLQSAEFRYFCQWRQTGVTQLTTFCFHFLRPWVFFLSDATFSSCVSMAPQIEKSLDMAIKKTGHGNIET